MTTNDVEELVQAMICGEHMTHTYTAGNKIDDLMVQIVDFCNENNIKYTLYLTIRYLNKGDIYGNRYINYKTKIINSAVKIGNYIWEILSCDDNNRYLWSISTEGRLGLRDFKIIPLSVLDNIKGE